ncbi:cytochrome P450 [Phyllosticta capitalensis]|uniref:Cytochrome P450 n=1 Tax=Phyllosticta capitalensis TaxID=121624 RepID=A0ABR1YKJ1_9PEZI
MALPDVALVAEELGLLLRQHPFATLAGLALALLVADYARMLWLRAKMPPGPLPWPIVGNTFSLPENKPWIFFEKLAKEYKAPMVTFWIGRNPTIWICNAQAASDLLDKRAGTYSSRPRMIVFAELGPGQNNLVNQYTFTAAQRERWRVHRKLMHAGVGVQQVRKYRAFQDNENRVVALSLLTEPHKFAEHFERYATSVVSIVAFGRRVAKDDDPIITEVIASMQLAAILNVPAKSFPMLMETFPILAKFPPEIAPWKRGLGARRKGGNHIFFHSLAKEALETPGHDECYAKQLFAAAPKYNLSPEEISSLAGNLFGAGSDTSSSTLITFVLACCAFPDVLPAAREELDRVVGAARSPSLDDQADLPYINAFVKEVFRWRSVAIIGGQPHAPVADDEYNGWLIPKGTWVQGNVWAIHRDPDYFPDPDRFNPKRFLNGGLKEAKPFPAERGYMTFGWGRRVCSGQALAEQGTFLSIARLLWGFKIEKARDADGREIPVDIFAYTDGLNMRPQPFKCSITPRSDEIRQTIEREGKQALEDLAEYEGSTSYTLSLFSPKK